MTDSDNFINISVIIPVFQDKDGLIDTVNSLIVQDFPQDRYEIIIVDNNSKDGTKLAARKLQEKYPGLIKVIHQDEIQSSYATRNAGVEIARGEICCFIDADMIAGRDYLKRIYNYFNQNDVDYLGCNLRINGSHKTLAEKFNCLFAFPMRKYFEQYHFAGTGCLSVRRSIFETVGLFDCRLESGGDQEFGHRVLKAGLKQSYCHDIILYHPPRTSILSLIKKERRKTRGKIQLACLYPARYHHNIESLFRIKRYKPLKPRTVKNRGKKKDIDLSFFECFLLSFLRSFIRVAGFVELIKQKYILRNRCLNLQGSCSSIKQDQKLKIYFIVYKPELTNHRTKLIFSLREYYPDMTLVYARKFGDCRDFNVAINLRRDPLKLLSRVGLKSWAVFLERYISFPSPKINYVKSSRRKLSKIIQSDLGRGDKVCVLNSLPPHDFALIGLYLKKKFPDIYWIVDWRDLWSYDERYFHRIPGIYRKRLERIEYEVLNTCDMNITTNCAAKRILEDRYNVPPDKVTSINHAFVPSDFQGIAGNRIKQTNARINGTIKIGFLGSLFKPPKVSGLQVLNAIKHASDSGIDVVLNIFGDSKKATIDAVNNTYYDVAVLYEKVSHEKSLSKISDCDFLLVALSDLPNCHIIYPAKLPHYLMLGKPIIAIVPDESAVANIIRETNSGYVIPANGNCGRELVKILLSYKNSGIDLKRNKKAIERYSWNNVSKDWINVINNVFNS